MALGLHLALLACLHQAGALSPREKSSTTPSASPAGLAFSTASVAAYTRAYVLQEIERLLRSTDKRWAAVAKQLAGRREAEPLHLSTARHKLSAMLRDVEREKIARRQALRPFVKRGARLPEFLGSPDVELAPPWLWRSPAERHAALNEAYAAVLRAANLKGNSAAQEVQWLDSVEPAQTGYDPFARLDALIHVEFSDPPSGSEVMPELQLHLALAYLHAQRRAQYRDKLLLEADLIRQDSMAAWRMGEVVTAQMLAAELEYLSVEVGSLEALVAYASALARIQGIIDHS